MRNRYEVSEEAEAKLDISSCDRFYCYMLFHVAVIKDADIEEI